MTDTSTTAGPRPTGRSGLDDAFARLRSLDVRRDTDRRWFGGVCAGLAARFDVDPLLIRAAAIALTIAGGLGIAVYLVLWLLLPDRQDTVLAERAIRQGDIGPVLLGVLTGLFLVGSLVSVAAGNDGFGGPFWLLIPIALVVWLLVTRARPGTGAWPSADRPAPYGTPGAPAGPPPYGTAPYGPAPQGAAYAGPPTAPYGVPPTGVTPPPPPMPGGPTMSTPTAAVPAAGGPAGVTATLPPPPPVGAPGGYALPPVPPVPPVSARPVAPPPPPRPRRRRPSGYVGLVSLGTAIVLGSLGAILAGPLGFPGDPAVLGFALALLGVSAVVLGLAVRGRASGFSGFLVVLLGALTSFAVLVAHSPVTDGDSIGDRVWTPTTVSLPASYSLGAGDATLDLDRLVAPSASPSPSASPGGAVSPAGPATIDVELGAGELTIEVPEGLTVRVESHVGFGEIRHEQVGPDGLTTVARDSGDDRRTTTVIGEGDPDVVVRTEVGFGDTIIEEN